MCKILNWLLGERKEQPPKIAALAAEIGMSIVQERARWKADTYHLTRDDGLKLWIANGSSFLKVEAPKAVIFERPSQEFLWRAYRAWCDDMTLDELMGDKKGRDA